MYTAETILIFPCPRKSFTFTRRRYFHFVANAQEKIAIIVIPRILLSFICKPKSHIFQILFKDSPKGILHVVKKDEKTIFLGTKRAKNAKIREIKIFLHVIGDPKLHIFENPYRDSLKGILHVVKKSHFLTRNQRKNANPAAGSRGGNISLPPPPSRLDFLKKFLTSFFTAPK